MKTFVTGFGRIGEQRELKFALEKFWAKKTEFSEVLEVARELKSRHYKYQKDANIDYISCNDFSFYDLVLDHIVAFGVIPERFKGLSAEELYFALARGNANAVALEMTKWFNTNYHYIVPEIHANSTFSLNPEKFLNEYKEAKANGVNPKINLVGPITFLALSRSLDGSDCLAHLDSLVKIYVELLDQISKLDKEVVVQIDEPIFVTTNGLNLLKHIEPVYAKLTKFDNVKIIFATYFEHANEAVKEIVKTKIWGVALDFVYGKVSDESLDLIAKSNLELFAGVIDGRNIWKSNFSKKLELIKSLQEKFANRLNIGTSCSLLHVPFTLKYETELDVDLKSWLSFAVEKLDELKVLKDLSSQNPSNEALEKFEENKLSLKNRANSKIIHKEFVQNRVKNLTKFERDLKYSERIAIQKDILNYPDLATTTIGSFPQTTELRQVRNGYKKGIIPTNVYEDFIKGYIKDCIKFQEEVGLDVLVHGEPERNDMVEYFGELLEGFAFSKNGWVQSYGSRCVKPPLLYADVNRPEAMTTKWLSYAQSLTSKIVKGMLTGPVTILNWSFVRDDKPRSEVAKEIALCINDEINDLQKAGIKIIQVDEAAFKEGYPLRAENIAEYEKFAVDCFKLSVSSAKPQTQIHTHMCYSQFNDIIKTIENMDADVISIETARSGNKLLKVFKESGYKAQVGPGVYDIHSPRIPSVEEIVKQIDALLEVLPKEQLWINPDCGLKTRKWEEVKPSLANLIEAVKISRV